MANKKQNQPRYNVATAIGPQQIIVVDFMFSHHLTIALAAIENGDPRYAVDFLRWLSDSLEGQDQDPFKPQPEKEEPYPSDM